MIGGALGAVARSVSADHASAGSSIAARAVTNHTSHLESRNKDRGWDKYVAELGYSLRGYHSFISALRNHYRSDDSIGGLVNDPSIPSLTIENCFLNLCDVTEIERAKQFIKDQSGAAAAQAAEASGLLHRSLLSSGVSETIYEIFDGLEDREKSVGWVCVSGIAGSGLSTLLQFVAYKWGLHEKLWHDRFDFVFRVKLNLLGLIGFWDGCPIPGGEHRRTSNTSTHSSPGTEHARVDSVHAGSSMHVAGAGDVVFGGARFGGDHGVRRLAWLIFHSLDPSCSAFSLYTIESCLKEYPNHVLLLMDGFDEIQSLYSPFTLMEQDSKTEKRDRLAKLVIETALALPNGIITARDEAISASWIASKRFRRRMELIGISTENVKQYVENYFTKSVVSSHSELEPTTSSVEEMRDLKDIARSLCAELDCNPELMALAQIPVNVATLCLVYDASVEDELGSWKNTSTTLLYLRMLIWLGRRYFKRFKSGDSSETNSPVPFADVLSSCRLEFSKLGELAYNAFKNNELQSLSPSLLQTLFSSCPELLHQLTNQLGLLRASSTPSDRKSTTPAPGNAFTMHNFIHVTYQEFFVAFHIMELLKQGSEFDTRGKDLSSVSSKAFVDSEAQWRSKLQEASRLVILDRHPRNTVIRKFLSGLLAMPIDGYSTGADVFWDACIDISRPHLYTHVGLHPQCMELQYSQQLLREALLTAEALKGVQLSSKRSTKLKMFETKAHFISQWTDACLIPELVPIFDFLPPLSKETVSARYHFQRRHQQHLHDRASFNLPPARPLLVTALLLPIATWARALDAILSQVDHPDIDKRVATAESLGYVHASDSRSIAALETLLGDRYWDVRRAAAEAIGRSGTSHERTLVKLRNALSDIYAVRIAAAEALGHIGATDESSLASLQQAMKDVDWVVRSTAIDALMRINAKDPTTVSLLVGALRDGSEYVRRSAVNALAGIEASTPEVIESLKDLLKDHNKRVRACAARALHLLGASDVISRAVLKQGGSDLSYMATITAKDIRSYAALRNAALKDSDPELRSAASEALRRIAREDYATLQALRSELRTKDWHVRQAAAETIARMDMHDPTTLAALCVNIKDRQVEVKLAAVKALKHMAKELDTPTIVSLLDAASNVTALLDNNTSKLLELSYELLLTLQRVSPLQYAVLFALYPAWLSSEFAQRVFVASIWLHSSSVVVMADQELMTVDGKEVSLSGSKLELSAFIDSLKLMELDFIENVRSQSADLAGALMALRVQIEIPQNTARYATMRRCVS